MTPSERERLNKELADIVQVYLTSDLNNSRPLNMGSVELTISFLEKIPNDAVRPDSIWVGPLEDLEMTWFKSDYRLDITIESSGEMRVLLTNYKGGGQWDKTFLFEREIPEEVLKLLYAIEGKKMKTKNSKGFTWVIGLGGMADAGEVTLSISKPLNTLPRT